VGGRALQLQNPYLAPEAPDPPGTMDEVGPGTARMAGVATSPTRVKLSLVSDKLSGGFY
jgi:hypothetical protein